VGGGPVTVEMSGADAERLREAGGEYGAATGRPRRVGPFDCVASRFGVRMQGADALALTKFDVLSYMEKIPVCVAYDIGGERVTEFPVGDALAEARPVYEYLPGFKTDISGCRSAEELPPAARDYIKFVEDAVNARIEYVSVGSRRGDYMKIGG
jgi:adenylosuccinate synthase